MKDYIQKRMREVASEAINLAIEANNLESGDDEGIMDSLAKRYKIEGQLEELNELNKFIEENEDDEDEDDDEDDDWEQVHLDIVMSKTLMERIKTKCSEENIGGAEFFAKAINCYLDLKD